MNRAQTTAATVSATSNKRPHIIADVLLLEQKVGADVGSCYGSVITEGGAHSRKEKVLARFRRNLDTSAGQSRAVRQITFQQKTERRRRGKSQDSRSMMVKHMRANHTEKRRVLLRPRRKPKNI